MTKLGTHPIDRREEISIDFDVVAKQEDVDLLRDAVLEIILYHESGSRRRILGPACEKLLERNEALLKEREEAKP